MNISANNRLSLLLTCMHSSPGFLMVEHQDCLWGIKLIVTLITDKRFCKLAHI